MLLITTALSLGLAALMAAVVWRNTREENRRASARVAALESELYGTESTGGSVPHNNRWPPQAVVVAAAGICVLGTIAVLASVFAGPGVAQTRTQETQPAPSNKQPGRAPLELMALTHERSSDELTVRGVVRNPAEGGLLSDVTAVVLVFDKAGSFVTSGRGTVAVSQLPSGSESTFIVRVPHVADIGRYRVSFRIGDGVLPHVDRRG